MIERQDQSETIGCWIYRSSRQDQMYLYLAQEEGFDQVPKPLMDRFGTPLLVMELDLHPERRLAREDVARVIESLRADGFHLQMPPEVKPKMYEGE